MPLWEWGQDETVLSGSIRLMDRTASGLLLMALGVVLLLWYYRLDRARRELVFRRLTEGQL